MSMAQTAAVGLVVLVSAGAWSDVPRSPSPEDAMLYFIAPRDGDVVGPTFTVKFGLKGMGVAPAGVDQPNTGHHHLLVNLVEEVSLDQSLPVTDSIIDFGGGETEAEVNLPPGRHTLKLMLGDYLHIPHDPPVVSGTITIIVEDPL